MKIAIHHRKGSFSERWIQYCKENSMEYGLVDAYSSDIITTLKGYDCFMWHFHHGDYRECLFAKELIKAIEMAGIKTFPNSNTSWHFDDKVAEKYRGGGHAQASGATLNHRKEIKSILNDLNVLIKEYKEKNENCL